MGKAAELFELKQVHIIIPKGIDFMHKFVIWTVYPSLT